MITCLRLQVLSIHSAEIEVALTQTDILKIKYTENRLKMSGFRNMVFHSASSLFLTLPSTIEMFLNTLGVTTIKFKLNRLKSNNK